MKRVCVIILALVLCFLSLGCSSKGNDSVLLPDSDTSEQQNAISSDDSSLAQNDEANTIPAEPSDSKTTEQLDNSLENDSSIMSDEEMTEIPPESETVVQQEDSLENDSQLVTEGEVTVTSLDELKLYADAELVTQDLFDYLSAFLVGKWEYPEVNDLTEITNYSISFTVPFDSVIGFDVYFTVSSSTLPTLPIGEYHRIFSAGAYFNGISDPDEVRDTRFKDISEVDKLNRFIGVNGFWNTPVFGEGKTFPGVYDYIHCYYGDVTDYFQLDYEELCLIAREEFGVTDPSQLSVTNTKLDGDRLLTLNSIYYPPRYKIEDVQTNAEGTYVTVRFYADNERLIYSHKIVYLFDDQGHFNGYEILEESSYQPWGLGFVEDK